MRRVAVTGLGVVAPGAIGVDAFWGQISHGVAFLRSTAVGAAARSLLCVLDRAEDRNGRARLHRYPAAAFSRLRTTRVGGGKSPPICYCCGDLG